MTVKPHNRLDQLRRLYRTQTNARLARRIQGVYLAKMGLTCPQIMKITGSARRTVQQWLAKYNRGGLDELSEKPRPGQPTKLPRHREQEFCRRLEAGPIQEDDLSVLNGPAIRRILQREFGILYSGQGLYDLLHRLGYSCLCPRPQHEQADRQAQEAFKKSSQRYWTKSLRNTRTKPSRSGSRMKPALASRAH
jgi:transposase